MDAILLKCYCTKVTHYSQWRVVESGNFFQVGQEIMRWGTGWMSRGRSLERKRVEILNELLPNIGRCHIAYIGPMM